MKKIGFILLGLLPLLNSGALDWGLEITSSNNYYTGNPNKITTQDRAEAWLSSTSETLFLRLAGLYEFTGEFSEKSTALVPYRFDLGNSFMTMLFPGPSESPSLSTLSLGRIDFSDASGRILAALTDGATFSHKVRTTEWGFLAGYTGLLNKDEAKVVISLEDFNESKDTGVYFAPKRIVAGGKFKALEVFERHDLVGELYSQFDLRETNPIHSQYLELAMEGRPLRFFKWKAYAIGQIWDDKWQLAMSAGARFQFSFPETLGLMSVFSVDWASGTGAVLRQFAPVNQTPVAEIYGAPFADILGLKLHTLIRPLKALVLGATVYGLFRASEQAPADPFFPSTGTSLFLGTEAVGMAEWDTSSELSLQLKGGAFIPNTNGAYAADAPVRWKASLLAKLKI